MTLLLTVTCLQLFSIQSLLAATIHVPADQPTIQAAIDSASNGDIVLVSPGTYSENLDFKGKAITVRSLTGSAVTIIDGGQRGSVVSFANEETRHSILQGFTVRNGRAPEGLGSVGGGVYCRNSSPTIRNNVITLNFAAVGGGIGVDGGSPYISGNNINHNLHDPSISGGWGGGITLGGGSSAVVIGNRISDHQWTLSSGGGVALNMAGSPLLMNNIIYSNTAEANLPGGGIWIVDSSPTLVQNLIFANTAYFGGGFYIDLSSTSFQATFTNNTFADNVSNNGVLPGDGSDAYIVGFADNQQFFNNIFTSSSGRESIYCAPAGALPAFTSNDGYSTSGLGFGGTCSGLSGSNGNISEDPRFVNPAARNYQLTATSPAIDAGDNAASQIPTKDILGHPRITDGDGNGTATVDLGVYELQ
jgi:hypothetical protein